MDKMDVAERLSAPAFYRLPEELLTMILDHALKNLWGRSAHWRCLTLKRLRLACRQFAYLPRLQATLFEGLHFVASPHHTKLAQSMDWSGLRPYVKRIGFQPTKYSWMMTQDLFEEIIMLNAVTETRKQLDDKWWDALDSGVDVETMRSFGDSDAIEEGWKAFLGEYHEGELPFSDNDLHEGYQQYMQRAMEDQQLFESGEIEKVWTQALKQLPDVGMFDVGFWDFGSLDRVQHREETKGKSWEELGCEIYEHWHGMGPACHDAGKCRRIQEVVGEALFKAATTSLTSAGSKITLFNIAYVADGHFKWTDNGQLDGLNIRSLETLVFQPQCAEGGEVVQWGDDTEAFVKSRCEDALTVLLLQCAPAIKTLEVQPLGSLHCPLEFPSAELDVTFANNTFPSLERLKTCATLNLTNFARFISRCPKLNWLEMQRNSGRHGGWHEVWRAIRHHPSRMHLALGSVYCGGRLTSIHHYTGSQSRYKNNPSDAKGNIQYSLESYLSNKGEWNESCRMWFT